VCSKKEKEKENLNPNEYSLYFSSPTFFLYSEQKPFNISKVYREMTKSKTHKQKKRQIYAHTQHHHGNDVLHRGEKTELCVCVCVRTKRRKKKKKKSSGKRKNLAQTDRFSSDDRIKASSNYFA